MARANKRLDIFVVTSGEYSDYGICAMFTERKDAEHYIEVSQPEYAKIEEWILNEHIECKKVDVFRTRINLPSGDLLEIGITKDELDTFLDHRRSKVWVFSESPNPQNWQAMSFSVVSQAHANKLAVEARQKWLRERAMNPSIG